MRRSQKDRILDYLAAGRSLTPLEALDKFGCNRLAARIHEIELEGHHIEKAWYFTESGAMVKEYWLSFPAKIRKAG